METDCAVFDLRRNLQNLGYSQPFPCTAAPLVQAILNDYVQMTDNLRDARRQINALVEEKQCWCFGMQPCKCENARLLLECNKLRADLVKQQEDYEKKSQNFHQRIRDLEAEKCLLNDQCQHLLKRIRFCLKKGLDVTSTRDKKIGVNLGLFRKPFISTIRLGQYIPNPCEGSGKNSKSTTGSPKLSETKCALDKYFEIELLRDTIRNLIKQVEYYKNKVESHDRDIERLNKLSLDEWLVNNLSFRKNCPPFARVKINKAL